MIRRWLFFSLALVGTAILAPSVHASLLGTALSTGPGNVAVPNESGNAALTGATLGSTNTQTISTSDLSGTLYTAVIKEANGTYDFLYQVVVSSGSKDGIARLTGTDFTGYATSVSYSTTDNFGYFQTGTVAPDSADRHTDDTVGFNFNSNVPKGSTSEIMIIGTNATAFQTGTVGVIDGVPASLSGFEPLGPAGMVPEPSTLAIAGLGALGMIGYGLRRRKVLGA